MGEQRSGWIRRTLTGSRGVRAGVGAEPAAREMVIEPDCALEGRLELQGPLTVNGEFKGVIDCQGDVFVGPHGTVEGPIRARSIELRGSVVGALEARREVVLCAGGRLHGDVAAPSLVVERGAAFEGRSTRVSPLVRRSEADAAEATIASAEATAVAPR